LIDERTVSSTPMRRIFHPFLFLLALAVAAQAQLSVNLEAKRRTYIRYEPIKLAVNITNLAGRDLLLEDGASAWFGFSVTREEGETIVPPRNPHYRLDPLEIKLGETVKRTVDLGELFAVGEYGLYRVAAVIYVKNQDKFYSSRPINIDISDGRVVWQQAVGVPETMRNAGDTHEFSLLAVQGSIHRHLYCRVMNPTRATVFGCYKLGNLIDGTKFDAKLDATNTLHVLHLVAPKTYSLTQIGVNGEVFGQWIYDAPKLRPYLRRDSTGNLEIVGATVRRTQATAKNAPPAPKLSDRPPGLPR
jgi:hypothetical protein